MILECFLVWKCTWSHGCNFKKYNIYEYSLLDLQQQGCLLISYREYEGTVPVKKNMRIPGTCIKKSFSSFKNHILQINTEFKT